MKTMEYFHYELFKGISKPLLESTILRLYRKKGETQVHVCEYQRAISFIFIWGENCFLCSLSDNTSVLIYKVEWSLINIKLKS